MCSMSLGRMYLRLEPKDLRILPNMSTALISCTCPCVAGLLLSKIQTSVLTPVSLAAGPLSEATSANQIGTEVVWPKHGGPTGPGQRPSLPVRQLQSRRATSPV